MKGHHHDGTQFGRKKEEAIAALLTQRNIEEAARATGVAATANGRFGSRDHPDVAGPASGQAVARLQQGIEHGPKESLAETTARAMGISVRELAGDLSYRYS